MTQRAVRRAARDWMRARRSVLCAARATPRAARSPRSLEVLVSMRWTTWTLFGLALAVCVGLLAMVRHQSQSTPTEFFNSVQEQIDAGHYDDELALSNL